MNEITIFNNEEFGQIRTAMLNDEPWFCLADVCKALGLEQVSRVKTRLNEYGVTTSKVIDSMGRTQNAIFINEPNLYKTIFQSRKPSAERFTDWVTSEVLPSIRKTGTYSIQKKETPQGRKLLALAVLEAQKVIEEQTLQIEEMRPKADYHDEVLNKSDLITTTAIAKDLGMTARSLNNILTENRILFKKGTTYFPYSNYQWLISDGLADYQIYKENGYNEVLKWTEKGRKWIIENIKEWL